MKKTEMIYKLSQEYFREMDDYQSDTRDKIKIVAPERYLDFIDHVLKLRIKIHIKLIAILQLSAGGRVSEILNLKKKDLDLNKKQVTIKVLKKPKWKKEDKTILSKLKRSMGINPKRKAKVKHRQGAISPELIPLLQEYSASLSPEDKLFNISRFGVLKAYKTLWGITSHSLRHSMITYMITMQGVSWDWIMNHFYFTEVKTAHRYFKQSTAHEADKIFKENKKYGT